MSRIYEIEQEIELALEKYYNCFNEDWELTATDKEFDIAEKELTELQNKKSEFLEWILKKRANLKSDINWIECEIKRLSAMKDRIQRRINQSESFIEIIVKPNYDWKTTNYWLFSVWFRKSKQTIIEDESLLDAYKKEELFVSYDKTAIKKDLEAGKEVKWARIEEILNLQIK